MDSIVALGALRAALRSKDYDTASPNEVSCILAGLKLSLKAMSFVMAEGALNHGMSFSTLSIGPQATT